MSREFSWAKYYKPGMPKASRPPRANFSNSNSKRRVAEEAHFSQQRTRVIFHVYPNFSPPKLKFKNAVILLLPKFKELASGVSSATWYCFLTVQPVLSLGLVGALGPSPEQLQAMCEHLDQHQPQTSSHIVPALPAVPTHAPNILRAVTAASTQVHNQQLALPAVSAVSV